MGAELCRAPSTNKGEQKEGKAAGMSSLHLPSGEDQQLVVPEQMEQGWNGHGWRGRVVPCPCAKGLQEQEAEAWPAQPPA